jgi:hypothetical protein
MAITNNLECFRGEDVTFPFYMSPAEAITGWIIRFGLKKVNAQGKIVGATMLQDVLCTHDNDPAGHFSAPLTAAMTTVDPGTYHYDVWRVQVSGNVVLTEGRFLVKPEVRY